MSAITNNHHETPLGLPHGDGYVVIRPGETVEFGAAEWAALKKRKEIAHYLDVDHLSEDKS